MTTMVATPPYNGAMYICALTLRQVSIAMIHSRPGRGKTHTVRKFASDADGLRVSWVDGWEGATPHLLFQKVLYGFIGLRVKGNEADLEDHLAEELRGDAAALVVIDNVEVLKKRNIAAIQRLYDRPETNVAIILIGGQGGWQEINRHDQLKSRIKFAYTYPTLTRAQILQVMPLLNPLFVNTDRSILDEICDLVCRGNMRNLTHYAEIGQELALADSKSAIDRPLHKRIVALMGERAKGG